MGIGARIGPRIGSQVGGSGQAPGAVTLIGTGQILFDEPGDTEIVIGIPPDDMQPGDSVLMVIVSDTIFGIPPAATLPAGWSIISSVTTGGGFSVTWLRRAAGTEPDEYDVPLVDGSGILAVGAGVLAYRGLNASAAVVGASAVDVSASSNYACPSHTLNRSTDLYLGVVWLFDAAAAITPPVGATERIDEAQLGDSVTPRQIEVFEFFSGVVGATGSKTATTAAPHSGVAASILLRASV